MFHKASVEMVPQHRRALRVAGAIIQQPVENEISVSNVGVVRAGGRRILEHLHMGFDLKGQSLPELASCTRWAKCDSKCDTPC
jgi:hypothetical protein